MSGPGTPPAAARTARPLLGLHTPAAGFDEPFAVLEGCHDRVRRSLALLQRLIAHLDHHGVDADARSAAGDVWRYFTLAAPAHHLDEERHVVPWLQAQPDAALREAAARMVDDHRGFAATWQVLGPALAALRDDGHDAGEALRRSARDFIDRHGPHLVLEDELAFPARAAATDAAERAAMGREMAARRGVAAPVAGAAGTPGAGR